MIPLQLRYLSHVFDPLTINFQNFDKMEWRSNSSRNFGWNFSTITADRRKKKRETAIIS